MQIFNNSNSKAKFKSALKIVAVILLLIILALTIYSASVYLTFTTDSLKFLSDSGSPVINSSTIKYKFVPLQEISSYCKLAFISTEDKTFYSNIGIDLTGTARLIITIASNQNDNSGGGSTISQQVIKLSDQAIYDRTLLIKLNEIIESIKLNQYWSKNIILETYLNNIYLGNYNYGIESASQDYFGKNSSELDLTECSFMAGLTQAPEVYNPYKNLDLGLQRQKVVLDLMLRNGFITQLQYQDALNETLNFAVKK